MNPIKKSQSFLSGSEDEGEEKKDETNDSSKKYIFLLKIMSNPI